MSYSEKVTHSQQFEVIRTLIKASIVVVMFIWAGAAGCSHFDDVKYYQEAAGFTMVIGIVMALVVAGMTAYFIYHGKQDPEDHQKD